tara:strand:- start:333 stop:629 length:297 start_codon:yes stop_codon:yes gene_type:complete
VFVLLGAGHFEAAHRAIDEAELSMQHVPASPLFRVPLAQTELEDRIVNALERAGIRTVGDLVGYTEHDLLDGVPGCGEKSVDSIKEILVREIARRRGK